MANKLKNIKELLKIALILSVTICTFNYSQAQTSEYNDDSLNGSKFNFPPLKVVIDSVLKRSAMLNFRKHHIGVKESTLASERIYWTRNLGIQADTKYGNLNNLSTNENGQISSSVLTTTKQFNYYVGFYLKFPVFDFFNKKHQLKLARLEVDEAKSMAEFQKEEIRQAVIVLYQDLILKQKLLLIKSRSLGNGKVNMQMVEKEFRNGIVPISEYVRITNMTSNMESDYELAKSNFLVAKLLLEDMAGFVFGLTHSN